MIETNRKLTKSNHAVLDQGKLEGALGRPMHTFGGDLLYPTLLGRAGALLDALVSAHAFRDGNKRTAWLSVNIYLNAFGSHIEVAKPEAADFVEAVALHEYDVPKIALWFSDRLA
ncbi:type II toxin-antitoxin system death-on-curing family toxin [Rhodococcus opacus]|uniref:Type II toxin-antitoxin system death-on-curing family toxin n=1 Tax=Rhodococcus opacus TaxID=37919 RepID=A0AAX3YAA9_RHOOP|nr:type II toxin-antitoxin system death-on-curing family toxin [Rhodococcus opacus]MCZ4586470.1 type II toxin-antitoxin system death-on-curing family toxin [Rhodococcus opacus]WLF45038.1 type II toxin-antitoxin system death-on-curing family toxin [Rhodococcus opacus]